MEPDPAPPAWAVATGLPAPDTDETFSGYVRRLGLDPEPMLDGLTEQTACIANRRLAHRLRRDLPSAWQAHIDARVAEHLTPERRRELQAWARSNLPPTDIH